jgi:hypothetical protein
MVKPASSNVILPYFTTVWSLVKPLDIKQDSYKSHSINKDVYNSLKALNQFINPKILLLFLKINSIFLIVSFIYNYYKYFFKSLLNS